jgi:arginase family enzyme
VAGALVVPLTLGVEGVQLDAATRVRHGADFGSNRGNSAESRQPAWNQCYDLDLFFAKEIGDLELIKSRHLPWWRPPTEQKIPGSNPARV